MRLTEAEWTVMDVLWGGTQFSLKEIAAELLQSNGWSKNTVHTYLTRMEGKGLVSIDRTQTKPYSARITRDDVARRERDQLLNKVYHGAAGDMIAAFLKETPISQQEASRLRKLLDDMEV